MSIANIDTDSVKSHPHTPEVKPKSSQETLPTTNTDFTIKFAPARKPVSGNIDVCCISLKWKDAPAVSVGSVGSMCRSIKNVYEDLSNKSVTLDVTTKLVPVSYNKAKKNLNKAEAEAKRKVGKYDLYEIVNGGVLDYEHAGSDTTHLSGSLLRTAYHETGHTRKFGLGHAGLIDLKTGKLDHYGDRSSFMGRYATNKINAPQMYFLGWLAKDKVAQCDLATDPAGSPAKEYKLEPVFSKAPSNALKGVLIPRNNAKPMLLSLRPGTNLPVLDLMSNDGAGTQQVGPNFSKELNYGGLLFERVSTDNGISTMRISQSAKTK